MPTTKRREVKQPFTNEEMRKAFTPIVFARKRRNVAKFLTPVGERVVKTV